MEPVICLAEEVPLSDRPEIWSRRDFVGGLTLAGTAGLLGMRSEHAAAEPPPETPRLRLYTSATPGPPGCAAPRIVVQEFLRSEGFTDVQYVPKVRADADRALASGEIDMNIAGFVGNYVVQMDVGGPIILLAGIHVGCFELFANDRIRTLRDLKGKTVGVTELGSGRHVFLASAMAYVGLDSRRDARLVHHSAAESMRLFAEGKMDAYQAFSEDVYELRDRKIGRVILDSTRDRPWSQYFCCMVGANREFVHRHPVAVKRALRAILKATEVCGLEPERAAKILLDSGHLKGEKEHEMMLRLLKALPYKRWREFSPEDTVRFYALRLHEAGMIRSTPQKVITQATDWRFLNELKKELKA